MFAILGTYIKGCFWTCILTFIINRYQLDDKKNHLLKAMLASFPLIYIASVRYNVGADYPTYMNRFIAISTGEHIEDFEILYHKLNELIAFFGGDFRWLFAVTSIIFCVLIFRTLFRDSPMPALSAFLLVGTTYYFCFFNTMRSMLAYAITLYSLKYVIERKPIHFLISVVIASGFHLTAFIFVFVYFIYDKSFSKKIVFFVTAGIFVLAPYIGKAVNYLMELTKYAKYFETEYADTKQGYITMFMWLAITVFSAFHYSSNDKKYQLYFKLQVITLWLTFLVPYVPLISRVRFMFGLPVIVLIPLTISKEKHLPVKIMLTTVIFLLYSFYCFYNLIVYNTNTVLPYQTIFQL